MTTIELILWLALALLGATLLACLVLLTFGEMRGESHEK